MKYLYRYQTRNSTQDNKERLREDTKQTDRSDSLIDTMIYLLKYCVKTDLSRKNFDNVLNDELLNSSPLLAGIYGHCLKRFQLLAVNTTKVIIMIC